MTSTINRPATTTEAPAPEPAAKPECMTFTVGTLTIEAVDEAAALTKYKRLVRAEALKAKKDMDWCDSGTNERLRILGLRDVGSGTSMRVRVVAERTAYITLDVDTEDEADELLVDGESPDILALATATVGRGWKALVVEKAPPREGEYKVGDPDDTTSMSNNSPGAGYQTPCEVYSSRHGYCTRPRTHRLDGSTDLQHAIGNGTTIQAVWN